MVMSMGMAVMMLVIAMLVVVMVITGMMLVVMMVAMIVRGMIMPGVGLRRAVRRMGMATAGIGAALGIERCLDLDHARAQTFDHRLDDVVAPYPQALRGDLRRQMAVAEMPGDAHQMLRIGSANLDQRLGCGDHLDQPAVLQHQRIAAAQGDGGFEVEQEFKPAR